MNRKNSSKYRLVVGGWIGSEIGKTMERYDPEENKWEVIGSMAVPRYYFGCCELQGLFQFFFLFFLAKIN